MGELKFVVEHESFSKNTGLTAKEFDSMQDALDYIKVTERSMKADGRGFIRMKVVTSVMYYSSAWAK